MQTATLVVFATRNAPAQTTEHSDWQVAEWEGRKATTPGPRRAWADVRFDGVLLGRALLSTDGSILAIVHAL